MTRRITDAEQLADLIHLHLDGKAIPNVDGQSASQWLEFLRFDRAPFNTELASRLGVQSTPPLVCEAAMTLRARLTEPATL